MEHEEIFFFCFWPFVNAQEVLEVTTKLSTFKGAINRYEKIPFTNTFEIRFFVSVKYDEI
jgi:hypothetical protein